MKRKYQNMLMESAELVGQIPAVNMTGATATAGAYVSAYNDYSEACRFLGTIALNIKQIDTLESTINKYKNKDDYDIDELQSQVEQWDGMLNKAYKDLKEFIAYRKAQNWQ